MRSLRYIRFWVAAGWALVGLVVALSLVPNPPDPLSFQCSDKAAHLIAYAGLMLWFGAIYLPGGSHIRFAAGFVLLGAALEGAQALLGTRTAQGFDILANSLGVSLGWGLSQTRLASIFIGLESLLPRGSSE